MSEETKELAGLKLSITQPTTVTMQELYNWVIWQMPRWMNDGLCGAVRPASPHSEWLPALLYLERKEVIVFGHLSRTFESPEKASEYLQKLRKSK